MQKEIIINKKWYDKLGKTVDELEELLLIHNTDTMTHNKLSYLVGYVQSLDEYFKDKK